jgi:hypothetical protein
MWLTRGTVLGHLEAPGHLKQLKAGDQQTRLHALVMKQEPEAAKRMPTAVLVAATVAASLVSSYVPYTAIPERVLDATNIELIKGMSGGMSSSERLRESVLPQVVEIMSSMLAGDGSCW